MEARRQRCPTIPDLLRADQAERRDLATAAPHRSDPRILPSDCRWTVAANPAPVAHQRSMGARGGLSRSPAKLRASLANLQKANEALRFLRPAPNKTGAERQAAYRRRLAGGR